LSLLFLLDSSEKHKLYLNKTAAYSCD